MNRSLLLKGTILTLMVVMAVCIGAPAAFAQDHEEDGAEEGAGNGLTGLGLGIGAGLAVGLAGLGTGIAQSGVGSGGTGAIAEKPELFTNVLILFAIPETIVILGFVIGFLLLNSV